MASQRHLLSGFLWLSTVSSVAQTMPNPTDTSYVMNLLKKAEAIQNSQPAQAVTYYQKALTFSKKINYTKGYFESMRLLTYQLNNTSQYDEALKLAQDALVKAKQDTSKRNLGLSYFALANTALFMGRFQEAIPNYRLAADYMQQAGSKVSVSVINQNLGYIYRKQGMLLKALEYYQKALALDTTLTEDPEDRRAIATDYLNIAVVYSNLEKRRETLAYYRKARQWIDPKKDLDFMVNLYNNLGLEHELVRQYDSAMYYRREALRVGRALNNPRHETHALMALAQTTRTIGKYAQARKWLDEALAVAKKNNVGLIELRNIYEEYVVVNEWLGDYKAVVKWLDDYIGANDSLDNQATKVLLQDYELKLKQADTRQKIAQKQRQIDQLEQQRQRQNLWLLIAGLVTIGVGGGLIFAYLYTRQRQRTADNALLAVERERELALVQSELQGQQKERLRISKEMHDDLGASLTAIGLLSEVVKSRMGAKTTPEVEKISSISAEMVTAMNEIIWSLNTKNDSLNGLIAYIRSYASEFIDNTSLMLRTDVEESSQEITMRGVDRRNVFLTVKEALNNVVKHAQATQVTLRIRPEADQLAIDVCDNGRGFTPSNKASLRNGLGNMQNRMTESGGRCEISTSSVGTCVKISYPYAVMPTEKIRQM